MHAFCIHGFATQGLTAIWTYWLNQADRVLVSTPVTELEPNLKWVEGQC